MSCCKGRPTVYGNATLWKINRDTGQLIWSADRGNNSSCLQVVTEVTDTMIYEAGTYSATALSVSKWIDAGAGGDRLWRFAKSTLNVGQIQRSPADGSFWLSHLSSTTGTRIDEDGAEINSGTVTVVRTGLANRSGGNMNYFSLVDGVSQYTTAFSAAGSIATSGLGIIRPLSSDQNNLDADAGWVWNNTATTLRQYTAGLGLDNTYSGAVGDVLHASTERVVTDDKKVFSVSPLALMHTLTIAGSNPHEAVFDPDNNVYLINNQSGTTHITAHDDTGAEIFDRSMVTGGGSILSYQGGKLYVLSGAVSFDLDNSADNFFLAALDPTTGATEWGAKYCRVAGRDALVDNGSVIYCCGNRVTV